MKESSPMTLRFLVVTSFASAALGVHCGNGGSSSTGSASVGTPPITVAHAPQVDKPAAAPPPASKEEDDDDMTDVAPKEKFENGRQAFESAKETLLKRYYAQGLSEDDLYRAAVAGMMEHADPSMSRWNKLLSPAELSELRDDLKGEIIGIGVQIHFEKATGYSDVLGLLPNSPAERAGILSGDKIVSVNGKLFKGKTTREIVSEIRGKVGEPVTLSILREDKLLTMTVTRDLVTYDPVSSTELPGSVGYVRIQSFTSKTVPLLKAALDGVASKGDKGLVLDLRQNHGGSFDDAVASAELFLPAGTKIVSLHKRDEKEESFVSKGSPPLATLPLVVLVDHGTSSGAELMSAALADGRHAMLVGAHTFGKWTVQTVDELSNGYAIKYTVSVFQSPSGHSYEGSGLAPDIEVDQDEKTVERAESLSTPEARVAADGQLRTALALLRR
jgi:carboxyl-terminal processing protease